MVVSAVQSPFESGQHQKLGRSRVLVSGAAGAAALGLLGLLAETGCRLVLDRVADPMEALAVAPAATILDDVADQDDTAVRFAQAAVGVNGGIDFAINIIRPDIQGPRTDAAALEAAMTDSMRGAFHITRVIANRMRTTWHGGVIVNVLIERERASMREQVLAQMTRATLAGFTRTEAVRWADDDIAILAIAPVAEFDGGDHYCPPGLAELALAIGAGKLASVSGVTLDPNQAGTWC
jgi:3-oxoacyl-[acyl-carrier protein] reductase